jgi:hypothetical protein
MAVSLIVYCVCVALVVPAIATAAAEERIGFSGAIVGPTCGVAASQLTPVRMAVPEAQAQRFSCDVGASAAAESQSYVLTKRSLSGSESDRVLNYFDGYVAAGRSDTAEPVLLTQTYE